jgi:heme exporter protein D
VDSLIAYFDMDGYAAFVWPSYLLAALVLVALFVSVLARTQANDRALARLEAAGAGRRRRRDRAEAEEVDTAAATPAPGDAGATSDP